MDEDKTIRKPVDNNNDKTLRKPAAQQDVDKTLRVPNIVDTDKTLRKPTEPTKDAGDTMDKTKAITKDQVPVVDNSNSAPEEFVLNGDSYKLKKIISESTGEAQIYLVENAGNDFILKLYYPQFKPKKELFEKLLSFNYPGIVKLFQFGEWQASPESNPRTFELMEYLQGGELDRVHFEKNEEKIREIAIQAAGALAYCHNNLILHKDVKPGNFFFRDKAQKQLVLGDFGIASLCDEDEMMHQTQQARTPIYAAPEMYITIDDNVEINGKVDFYSLGIMLMYVWTGENPFKGNERAMTNMKRFGELPYPKDAPAHILQLMQGLTVVNPEKRWGFDEVKLWYNGESVAVAKNSLARYKQFVFDADQNMVAANPAELAVLMDKDPKLAIKYLYGNHITKWLEEAGNNKLSVEVYDICEKRYPRNQQAGLRAAIYLFNPQIQYKAIDGKLCADDNSIVEAIYKHRDKYAKVLQNTDDDFYIYMESFGKNKEKDTIQKFFKQNDATIAIWKTLYYLDDSLPFVIETVKDKGKNEFVECTSADEIIVAFRDNNISDDAWNSFLDGRFYAWLEKQPLQDEIQAVNKILKNNTVSDSVKIHAILFNMNKLVSFNLYLPNENDDQYYFTQTEIGNLFNHYARRKFQEKEKNTYLDMCIDELTNDQSILYYYFQSKNWKKELDWVKFCFEIKKGDNKKKCGPYNKEIALYKAIKGLGFDPYFYFKKSKKYVYNLDELAAIDPAEIASELEKGTLKNWLTIFYQEDPFAELNESGAYETLTVSYVNKLQELNESNPEARRFFEAIDNGKKIKDKVKKRMSSLNVMRLIFGLLFIIPSGLLLAWLIIYKIPLTENPLPGAFWKVSSAYWVLATIVLGIYTWIVNNDGGFFVSLIAGLIEALILYYVVYLIVALLFPVLNILSIILVVLGIGGFIWAAFGPFSSTKALRNELLADDNFDSQVLEPLYHAFHPSKDGNFESSTEGALTGFYDDLARSRKKLLSWIIPGILTFVLLSTAFFLLHPQFYDVPLRKNLFVKAGFIMSDEQITNFPGIWEGIFDERAAVLTIDSLVGDSVHGSLSVKYKKSVTESIKGVFDFKERTLNFTDVDKNKKLDGSYKAELTENLDTLRGNFRDQNSSQRVKFEFVKQLTESDNN